MEIQKVSIIGFGALGVMFGDRLVQRMDKANLKFIADQKRIRRYERDGVYVNGIRRDFDFVTPDLTGQTDDLIMFAVKFNDLNDAIRMVKNRVGPGTILLSMLNGISSEEIIAKAYGWDKVICCVAQEMDALKVDNRLRYANIGKLCIGVLEKGSAPQKVLRVARFFEKTGLPYEVCTDMKKRMWGKWMTNVGVNQTLAVYGGTFSDIQKSGEARETMIKAMREVIALAQKAGVELDEADLKYWLDILGKLDPTGKPSMLQDVEAKRKTEVELFAGTVTRMGREYGIVTPTNDEIYRRIAEIEASYDNGIA